MNDERVLIRCRQTFYDPPERGFGRELRKRLDYWAKLRRERR
jgi:putative ATPase